MNTLQKLVRYGPFLARGVFDFHVTRRFKPLPPVALSLSSTMWCDSKCVICNIWQLRPQGELKAEQFDQVFESPLFREIRFLQLGGGEPTLRPDLLELFRVLLRRLPRLAKGNITTNSFRPKIVVEKIDAMMRLAEDRGVDWGVRLSLDGVGEVHDRVRGIPGGFQKVLEVLEGLRRLPQVRRSPGLVKFGCTICKANMDHIEEVAEFARREGVGIGFNLMRFDHYFNNDSDDHGIACGPEDVAKLADFFASRPRGLLDFDRYFFDETLRMTSEKAERTAPCIFQSDGIALDSWANLFYCHPSKKLGNCYEQDPEELYYGAANLAYREEMKRTACKSCSQSCFGAETFLRDLVWLVRAGVAERVAGKR